MCVCVCVYVLMCVCVEVRERFCEKKNSSNVLASYSNTTYINLSMVVNETMNDEWDLLVLTF